MTIRRLISLAAAIVLLLTVHMPAGHAEELLTDVIVRSAPLIRSDDVLDGMVRVYLSSISSPSSLKITVTGTYTLEGTDLVLRSGDTVSTSFQASNGSITITAGGKTYSMGQEAVLKRHQDDKNSGVAIAQAKRPSNLYHGDLQLLARSSGSSYKLYPIVHVYMETYLYGVVPYEMSSSSHLEALKAQAVAARTYTLNRMNTRASNIYDVVDTTSDQVYYGYSGAVNNATKAVDATRGIVAMNDGKLTGTYYTASNGGQTEAVKNAWGSSGYPYLNVKDDPFDALNTGSNRRRLVVYKDFDYAAQNATLAAILTRKVQAQLGSTAKIDEISGIIPHTPKYPSPSRLYTKLDFSLIVSVGTAVQEITVSFSIFDDLETQLGMSINSSQNELWTVSDEGSSFAIVAGRHGHGIGMSQRGAQKMANMSYTYDQILGFYYTDCIRMQHTFTNSILPPVGEGNAPVVNTEAPATIEPPAEAQARISLVGVTDNIALRYTADDEGRILTAVPNGSAVTVLARGDRWTLVRAGLINGYVPTECLIFTGTPPAQTAQSATNIASWATVSGSSSLNLRIGPGTDHDVVTTLPSGAVLCILATSGSWVQVQYGVQNGYCMASYLTMHTEYPGAVSMTGTSAMISLPGEEGHIDLLGSASTSAAAIMQINHGTQVSVLSDDGSWSCISVAGTQGYVLSSYLDYGATGTEPTVPPMDQDDQYATVNSTASTLNLRQAASTDSKILAEIPRGTVIVVTAYGETWCAVRWGSLTGFVMTKYLLFNVEATPSPDPTPTPAPEAIPEIDAISDAPAPANGQTAWIISGVSGISLRNAASQSAKVLASLSAGDELTVYDAGDVWARVMYGSQQGYVYSRYLTFASPEESLGIRYVNTITDPLTMRSQPNQDGGIVARIPRGSRVTLLKELGDWSQVQYGQYSGYCAARYLSEEEPSKHVTDTTALLDSTLEAVSGWEAVVMTGNGSSIFLRQWCSTEAPTLTEAQDGAHVELLEKGNIWCRISYEGEEGYCLTSSLTLIAPRE